MSSSILVDLTASFWVNVKLFIFTLPLALPLGLIISFGSMNKWQPFSWLAKYGPTFKIISIIKPISWLCKTVVWIIRGTPLLLQLLIIFFGPSLLWGVSVWGTGNDGRFTAAVVALIINYACYLSEIFRGGIQSIPIGQTEAGQVLGMTKSQIFFKIILLQVIKRIVPPMSNEIINLIKDTSLARLIAVPEILMAANRYASRGLIVPLFTTGVYFLAFVGGLTLLFGWVEKKLSYFKIV